MRSCRLLGVLVLVLFWACDASPDVDSGPTSGSTNPSKELRIVSLNGAITELLYSLNLGDQLVGVDVTSTYPAAVHALPKLGHVDQLNLEGMLELRPNLILVPDKYRDHELIQKLETKEGAEVVYLPHGPNLMNAAHIAHSLSEQTGLDVSAQLDAMSARLRADSLALREKLSHIDENDRPSVLFIYARGTNRILVAGADTEAAQVIEMAGGRNAIPSLSGFKPMTSEALATAAPDYILMFSSGLASLDGRKGLSNIPLISQTPAYQNDRIITMDGHYLMGFGPRAGQAALALFDSLHPPANL